MCIRDRNSPSSQGAIGDIYNTNTPSLTLGCGSYGKNMLWYLFDTCRFDGCYFSDVDICYQHVEWERA